MIPTPHTAAGHNALLRTIGSYSDAEAAQIAANAADYFERLADALQSIKGMTDADNPESYRCDDPEGCLDTVFSVASDALDPQVSPTRNLAT